MKTREELNAIKEEFETLSKKLAELNDEELNEVIGGETEIYRKDFYENIILSAGKNLKVKNPVIDRWAEDNIIVRVKKEEKPTLQ